MEHLEWFVKPGAAHTFHAEAAAEPYTEAEAAEALAKGVGRVTAEALQRGRPPRNWFEIARENSRSKERQYGPPHHPSMKPLKICERLVDVHSSRGETVLVPFGGSGSECVSVVQAGRRVIAFETELEYYNLILRRMDGHGLLPSHITPPPKPADGGDAALCMPDAEGGDGDGGNALALAGASVDIDAGLHRDARYTSGYMGVYKHGKRWVAKVMRDGQLRSLGRTFSTPREAAAAYAREVEVTPDDERPAGRQSAERQGRILSTDASMLPTLGDGMVGGASLLPLLPPKPASLQSPPPPQVEHLPTPVHMEASAAPPQPEEPLELSNEEQPSKRLRCDEEQPATVPEQEVERVHERVAAEMAPP